MKRLPIFVIALFSSIAFASEGLHDFSSKDNPHAKGGCASKSDKVVRFHQFHEKSWRHENRERKLDVKNKERKVKLSDFI